MLRDTDNTHKIKKLLDQVTRKSGAWKQIWKTNSLQLMLYHESVLEIFRFLLQQVLRYPFSSMCSPSIPNVILFDLQGIITWRYGIGKGHGWNNSFLLTFKDLFHLFFCLIRYIDSHTKDIIYFLIWLSSFCPLPLFLELK